MIAWIQRNFRMVFIVTLGIFIARQSIRDGNWISAIPMSAIAIGVALNVVAMIANRGKMPVNTDGSQLDKPDHDAMNSQTRLRKLGDWILFGPWMISPGDILLCIGLVGVVFLHLLQCLL